MSHPNEQMLREAYAKFAAGDPQGFLGHCTPDITFDVPGKSRLAGTYTRAQFISSLLAAVGELTQGTFREEVLDVVANDTRGVVLARHELRRNGTPYSYDTVHVYRIENGKLAEFAEYPRDLHAFEAAWGEPGAPS